jgi:hypothetical protein
MITNESTPKGIQLPDLDSIDIKKVNPLYGLKPGASEPDFIPFNPKGRDFLPRLFFNSGVTWLSGYALGGLWGARSGWKAAANPSLRVRLNSVMNGISNSGTGLGNAGGIIGTFVIPYSYEC